MPAQRMENKRSADAKADDRAEGDQFEYGARHVEVVRQQ